MKEEYRKNFIQAGKLAGEVRAFGKSLIVKGASYNDVLSRINEKIKELGAFPAFPPQIALNEVAAHFLVPPGQDVVFQDQIVKLDVGVCYGGAIGDCAVTIDLSGKFQNLVAAAESALLKAEESLSIGLPIRQIGKIIDETIASFGAKSIKNLSGHGLGYYKVHAPPTIPNYDNRDSGVISRGMTFAIEPFATNGQGLIYEWGRPTIFSQRKGGLPKSERGKRLMEKIKAFKGLPFAVHALLDKDMPLADVEAGLLELLKGGSIAGYPPLVEQRHGMVAQAENSVLVDDEGEIFITTRL